VSAAGCGAKAGPAVTHEEIARYAYRLFEERGRVHGHALDDWLAAERALSAELDQEEPAPDPPARRPIRTGRRA
jgi:hypothetical protein